MRFAILEDDPAQMEVLTGWLREAGHDVHGFAMARELMRVASRESFDLFLVDWVLPDLTGEQVLRWLRTERNNDTPAIFITSRDAEDDIASAFSAGADDYLVKPPRRIELLSRIEAVLRRTQPRQVSQLLQVAPYSFDLIRKMVTVNGEPVEMTDKEFELAAFLFRNMGRLLSRGHLLEAVWGRNPDLATRTVDTHISRVRSKLNLRPENGFRLTPTYNFGYRLERVDAANLAPDGAPAEGADLSSQV
ncbi:MAG TPA: response regulator transcription factor [Rhodocyclaceae bacterium]|nr:response regulator transcription factor [Rhodocyclaceae bacterium]HMV62474.1 response regulator transcription factor [Rhodocyclaceae bacterium]HMZ75458.1 response regulator transcription factor [Rhodocyclaceae bacterium]HNA67223.1 response regulator transcription factor [Rhodocyclaceae bacterium]HNB64089.1 response regulator transcription factor [Rhodocyclaceae bacterium]